MHEVYEFFTRYVRRIHPDTHWKKAMKMNPNVVWFQLITPSDVAFVILLVENGMPVWNKKKVLFDVEESKKTKAKPLFTSGEGQKRSFGKTTWSKEGLKYFHKVERTCIRCIVNWSVAARRKYPGQRILASKIDFKRHHHTCPNDIHPHHPNHHHLRPHHPPSLP